MSHVTPLAQAPVVISRDHHDVSGTDSPFRETSNVYDGSAFCAGKNLTTPQRANFFQLLQGHRANLRTHSHKAVRLLKNQLSLMLKAWCILIALITTKHHPKQKKKKFWLIHCSVNWDEWDVWGFQDESANFKNWDSALFQLSCKVPALSLNGCDSFWLCDIRWWRSLFHTLLLMPQCVPLICS